MAKTKVIDPRSADVVLFYTGGTTPVDVTTCDLSGNDLARVIFGRALWAAQDAARPGASVKRPAPATADQLEALATELCALGSFAREPIPVEPAKPGKEIV